MLKFFLGVAVGVGGVYVYQSVRSIGTALGNSVGNALQPPVPPMASTPPAGQAIGYLPSPSHRPYVLYSDGTIRVAGRIVGYVRRAA